MFAEIITIGDEILIGQVIDTNSAWIATQFNENGIWIKQITSVSDKRDAIINAIKEAESRADIIVMTGGLGPTRDDITKKVLADFFDSELVRNEHVLKHITEIFSKRNIPLLDINLAQADVPEKCTVLYNPIGTAPGMWFEKNNKVYVSLPGVPYEMKALIEKEVLYRIKDKFKLPFIAHQTIVTAGIGESFLSKKIEHIEDALPSHIRLAYLPHYNTVRLRFSAEGPDKELLENELKKLADEVYKSAPEYVIGFNDEKLEVSLGNLLKGRNKSLSTAESCTGGYLAHLITSIPGASAYFPGSVISYSNEIKIKELGVNPENIKNHGAVSEEVVIEMLDGILKKTGSNYGISISGIAGPDGGSEEKPVGTVWIGYGSKESLNAKKFLFYGGRQQVIERSALTALQLLYKFILNDSK